MDAPIGPTLIDRHAIARRLGELADRIAADTVAPQADAPAEITLVPVLTGSFMFAADLIRHLPLRLQIHLMGVSSYPGKATTSQGASLRPGLTDLPEDLTGLHVLVIDDILDSGRTLRLVRQTLAERGPTSLRTCVLLRKQRPEALAERVDYVAFDVPDVFVVGYGLDYDGYYRNLPDIMQPETG
jgi:hypoxanthine phosphoribosyltransferase